jgi:hypothetical protein
MKKRFALILGGPHAGTTRRSKRALEQKRVRERERLTNE